MEVNREPCDRCGRKIWDPVEGGFLLYCFGHYDNGQGIFVSAAKKKNYTVKVCGLFYEISLAAPISPELIVKASCAHKTQSRLEGFI